MPVALLARSPLPLPQSRGLLTATLSTRDLDRAHRLAAKVPLGYAWVNDAATHSVGVPFGGYEQSGMDREDTIEELRACTQIKSVNVTYRADFRRVRRIGESRS